ncbi:MAG TPA: NUDIX hydrolase [Cryptosporangiaceae bacterium]|nr:NUDIX hydrolase [Cryptosporangiaceae bacterium]
MRWTVRGRRTVYESAWVNVHIDDVELPDGRSIEHHVVAMPRPSVGALVLDGQGNTLLIWRHRFIPDVWGWEVPAGWVDPGEDLVGAVRREVLEETGWSIGRVEPLVEYNPLSGLSTMRYSAFVASEPEYVGSPDDDETSRVTWVPLDAVPELAVTGEITDGPSLLILSYYLAIHRHRRGAEPAV